jgi:putative DNA primase/helicase
MISLEWTETGISPDLRALPRWLCWQAVERAGKWTKVPVSGRHGGVINATSASTWVSYEQAAELARRCGFGVGIALGDGLTGIDLDRCRNPQGIISAWAIGIVQSFATYAEVSPSGTGVKLFLWADFHGGRRQGPVEVYGSRRFFTVTGARLESCPTVLSERQRELDSLLARLFPPKTEPTSRRGAGVGTLADDELVDRAMRARNGERFRRLWAGEWQALGYGSQSEADAALAAMLAYWTDNDPSRVDALFRMSGLCRSKWTERADYRQRTLAKVLH